jgi:inorganic triphosphatase YgiF
MSVVKSKRGESNMEFIDAARKLEEHTLSCCMKAPKRDAAFLTSDIMQLAGRVHSYVVMANSVYVTNQEEARLRRSYFTKANACLQDMNPKLSLLYSAMTKNHPDRTWVHNAMKVWGELMVKEANLIAAIKKREQERFKNMPQ